MKWHDYVIAYEDEVIELWGASRKPSRESLFVLGEGFDPRALTALRAFAALKSHDTVTVAVIELPRGRDSQSAVSFVEENSAGLADLASSAGFTVVRIELPVADRLTVGQVISQRLQGSSLIPRDGLVVIDVSALPYTFAFPIIGGMLASAEQGIFRGDLQVTVCENPELDKLIVEEGAADPGPLGGFSYGWTKASDDTVRIWAPVLGERQGEQLATLYAYLEPNETMPVLPFPAVNPRRADDLVVELRELLFDTMKVVPSSFIYAHETNPFDVYRALWRLNERLQRALEPLGRPTLVTSVHGSKMLSIGVLLASRECRLPLIATSPSDYLIPVGVDLPRLGAASRLSCVWLAGEPYQ
jgi:hypothetical protein